MAAKMPIPRRTHGILFALTVLQWTTSQIQPTDAFILSSSISRHELRSSILVPTWQRRSTTSSRSSSRSSKEVETTEAPVNEIENDLLTKQNDDDDVKAMIDLGLEKLQPYFDFPLDDWQLQAGGAVLMGHNIIVSAPTGAGKTVAGEMALRIAFTMQGKHAIYTTPLKALSNQKYADLCAMFGKSNVGLSTGDISINKGAPVTVMTTEVYRNIAWRASSAAETGIPDRMMEGKIQRRSDDGNDLTENAVVVLDEFHYMGHPGRGGVWEESVITSPAHTQIIGLSATLPNAPQLTAWMEHVTGRKTVLINISGTKARPVPLRYLFATREGLFPLFRDSEAGPGAPKGLLGLRGDGLFNSKDKLMGNDSNNNVKGNDNNKTTKGLGDEKKEYVKLPRGLHVNPQLKAAADKRLQKVNRAIERKKVNQMRDQYGGKDDESDYQDRDWGVGRGKRRPMPKRNSLESPRQEKRERERLLKQELRRSVPSLPILLKRLNQKEMLPAIFFLFSRAGCEEAARNACNFMRGPTKDMSVDSPNDPFATDGGRQPRKQRKTRRKGRSRSDGDDDTGVGVGAPGKDDDIVKDAKGRMFRLSNNYVSDDVLEASINEIFEEDTDVLDDEDPLNKDNFQIYARSGLLSYKEVEIVAAKIEVFNAENPEIAFPEGIMLQYMFGVGSHHAGMLPSHKSFVEILFRNQLMKAVFATETLAAGINMPARTTVICALAKRGDGSSMNLLETSNLLQMAGRAGRRGFDENGYCVIVASPFENHDDAAKILTDPIKPIRSQFSPSFALAINLVARGNGKLDVAKQLVGKSFALWEKTQIEQEISAAVETHGEGVNEILEASAQERFMITLVESLQAQVDGKVVRFDISYVEHLLSIMNDRELLKKASKTYLGATKMLEIEQSTLGYLESELATAKASDDGKDDDILQGLFDEDQENVVSQIKFQRDRTAKVEKDIRKHPFTAVTNIANELMQDSKSIEGKAMLSDLQSVREYNGSSELTSVLVKPEDLCTFAKSAIVIRRKTRKFATKNPEVDAAALLDAADMVDDETNDTWEDMLAITKVLVAYGCLSMSSPLKDHDSFSFEKETFEVTPAGNNIGMLGFENALWCLSGVGGAWDTTGASSRLDEFRSPMDDVDDAMDDSDWYDSNEDSQNAPVKTLSSSISKAQEEAEDLASLIRSMTPSQLAGYVSCLINEGSRGGGGSVIDVFQKMEPTQQRVIQSSLQVMDRLMEVQKEFNVDENTRNCNFDVSNCAVVTAWAAGCTWSEALQISGSPPGDLARNLSRVLDAVRQLGNLPYRALRKEDFATIDGTSTVSPGLHPDVRALCREAARAINRYPVKDPLQFAEIADDDEIEDGLEDDATAEEENVDAEDDAEDGDEDDNEDIDAEGDVDDDDEEKEMPTTSTNTNP